MNQLLIFILGLLSTSFVWAQCQVKNSLGSLTEDAGDALYVLLKQQEKCPQNVLELKSLLEQSGLYVRPSMVANRGYHNPTQGSFSFFEMAVGTLSAQKLTVARGDFFYGHFTKSHNGIVVLDQNPKPGKLLIEALVWDPQKQLFNFYELIGTKTGGDWFYRGDSKDALLDNAYLYRDPPMDMPKFGFRMRCSACHISGSPIMKELSYPHNDWWITERPLPLGPNRPSPEVSSYLSHLLDASNFSDMVRFGMHRLESSPTYKQAKMELSLAEQLRPLFCDTEINLVSDLSPLESPTDVIQIPPGFILNSYWTDGSFFMDKLDYIALLYDFDLWFPETAFRDADHAWLVPVKGFSDMSAIQTLIHAGLIDDEFVADVLALNLEKPLFSDSRCALLKLLPDNSENWMDYFLVALEQSEMPSAWELAHNLVDPHKSRTFHQREANRYQQVALEKLKTPMGRRHAFKKMIQIRQATFEQEISQNPNGQILEPGFRVIFPVTPSDA